MYTKKRSQIVIVITPVQMAIHNTKKILRLILVCLWFPHEVVAFIKSKSCRLGPSIEIHIKWSKFRVLSELRETVFIRFMVEKDPSHSAVLIGRTRALQPVFSTGGRCERWFYLLPAFSANPSWISDGRFEAIGI